MRLEDLGLKFWSRVVRADSAQCWRWAGNVNKDGYGVFNFGAVSVEWGPGSFKWLAHRLAYRLHHGELPADLLVRHTCDNRFCVNPNHLVLGDHADNAEDMYLRGRAPSQKRTHCKHGHELTPENTYTAPGRKRGRDCRTCIRDRARRYSRSRGAVSA